MDGSGSRFLWVGLLAPPLLVLAAAGAMTLWPQQVVGMIDRVAGLWSPAPSGPRRPSSPMMMTHDLAPFAPPTAQIKGTIRKPDGSPYTGDFGLATIHNGRRSHSSGFAQPHRGPDFLVQASPDHTWIVVDAEGYAPTTLGPIESQDVAPESPPRLVELEEGFPHRVRVVDAEGAPIALAEVHASLTLDRRPAPLHATWITDSEGWATFPHVKEAEYEFDVKVHGASLPDDTVFVTPKPGEATTIKLDRASSRGVVLDEDGRPVADAVILVAAEFDQQTDRIEEHPFARVVLAKSDAEGRFPLPHLHEHLMYLIRADGPDGSRGYAPGIRQTSGEVQITLRPRRLVRGILKRGGTGGPLTTVAVERTVPTGFDRSGSVRDVRTSMKLIEDIQVGSDGSFEYPAWGSVESELMIGGKPSPVPWPPPPEPIVFEQAAPAEVGEIAVVLRIRAEAAGREVRGAMTLSLMNAPPEMALQTVRRLVPIERDQGKFRCLQTDGFRYDSSAIPGYWTVPGTIVTNLGGGDRIAEVRVFAAGPIKGRVTDVDGSPAAGAEVSIGFAPGWAADATPTLPNPPGGRLPIPLEARPPAPPGPMTPPSAPMASPPTNTTGVPFSESVEADAEGRFVIPSWPLNVPSRLVVARGRYSTNIDRSGAEGGELAIRLPKPARGEVQVVDPDGRPLAGIDVRVILNRPQEERQSWGGTRTDADGRTVFDDLAAGEENYTVSARFDGDFRAASAPLKPGGPPTVLKPERGRVLEGRVVEAVTGWPIPKAEVVAEVDGAGGASARADADGRFRFTTLPDGPLKIRSFATAKWVSPQPPEFPAGSEGPVEIRLMELQMHDPQPIPPARP